MTSCSGDTEYSPSTEYDVDYKVCLIAVSYGNLAVPILVLALIFEC